MIDKVREAIWAWIFDLAAQCVNEAFKLLTDFILIDTNIEEYADIGEYVFYSRFVAYGLLGVAFLWEVFKQVSNGMVEEDEKPLSSILMKVIMAGFLIYFLPWSVDYVFIPINNALVQLIQSGSQINLEVSDSELLGVPINYLKANTIYVLLCLVFGVSAIVLGILAGLRYVELIIAIIIAPITAVSSINKGDAISVWVRETTAIVFTQVIHALLLKLMVASITKVGFNLHFLIGLGCMILAIKGPQILRKYLYTAGVGSGGVKAVGSAGRMAAFKFMMGGK